MYSEMLPCTQKLKDLTWKPVGIILSGGPSSVYSPDAPSVDPLAFELGVPVLYVVCQKSMMKRSLTCHEEGFVLAIN